MMLRVGTALASPFITGQGSTCGDPTEVPVPRIDPEITQPPQEVPGVDPPIPHPERRDPPDPHAPEEVPVEEPPSAPDHPEQPVIEPPDEAPSRVPTETPLPDPGPVRPQPGTDPEVPPPPSQPEQPHPSGWSLRGGSSDEGIGSAVPQPLRDRMSPPHYEMRSMRNIWPDVQGRRRPRASPANSLIGQRRGTLP